MPSIQQILKTLEKPLNNQLKGRGLKLANVVDPWRNPLWRSRALWLLENHPAFALQLLDSNQLEKELDRATKAGVSVLLQLKKQGMSEPEAKETALREVVAPSEEPRKTPLLQKDRRRFMEWLDNHS